MKVDSVRKCEYSTVDSGCGLRKAPEIYTLTSMQYMSVFEAT